MADKQAVFTLKVNTGNSVQDVQNFDQSVNKLNKDMQDTQKTAQQGAGTDTFSKKLDELDKKLSSGTLTFREMTKLMKDYQTIAAQAGTETPVGDRAVRAAAGLKDTLTDLQVRTKLLSSDYVKLDTALAGVETGAAAFQGVQSAIALTGVESEALVQTMVKLQAAQGLVNAVSTVANKLNKDAILGIQIRTALQKAQNFVLYGTVAATQAEAGATKVAAGAKVAMTAATGGANIALKLFRLALISTGIGALVVGIGLLIANFDKVLALFAPLIDGFKAIGDAIGLSDFAGDERRKNISKQYASERAEITKTLEKHQEATKSIEKRYDRELELARATGVGVEKLEKEKLNALIQRLKEEAILQEKQAQLSLAELDETRKSYKRLNQAQRFFLEDGQKRVREAAEQNKKAAQEQIADYENQLKVNAINERKAEIERAKERKKQQTDRKNEQRALNRALEDEEIKAIADKNQREQTQLIVSARRRIEDLSLTQKDRKKNAELIKQIQQNLIKDLDKLDQDWYNQQLEAQKKANGFRIQQERELSKTLEDIAEQNFLATLSDEEREILAIQDKYFELETLAQGNADALKEIEIAKLNALNNVNVKYQDERDKRNEEQRQKDLKREQDVLEFKLYAATETFKLISDVTDLFAKKGEKSARRAFMIQKASSIAQATIETYKGANAIFASAAANPQSILFPAQPFIAAGLAISAGIANVAKIASQKFEGGSQSASGGGAEVPSNLTGASASSFTANTNAQTTDLTTLGQGAQPNVQLSQVVVLESDITGTQNKVKLQEAKTSF